jgi:F-type H+-transporting ATPase subunit b
MPQFDPAVWPPQFVWLVICFIALYLVMSRIALPRISAVLEEREFRINESLRKAEALRHDADVAVAAYERLMSQARTKAQEQLRVAREQSAREASERHAELSLRLADDLAAADARIAAARNEAVAGIRDVAVEVAGLAVERLIGEKVSSRSLQATVDQALRGEAG